MCMIVCWFVLLIWFGASSVHAQSVKYRHACVQVAERKKAERAEQAVLKIMPIMPHLSPEEASLALEINAVGSLFAPC